MKLVFAALVTLINVALALYSAYHSLTLVGKIGFAEWVGTTLAVIPFLLVAIYGLKPGSPTLWNWAFSLNALILLVCVVANVVEFRAASGSSYAVWSVTVVVALFSGFNIAFLLGFPPRSKGAKAASPPVRSEPQ